MKYQHSARIKANNIDAMEIRMAAPETIRRWSHGEITKPETINYRTGRSERGGLFDERIFGPEKDYHCYCGKYKGVRYRGIICEKCNVEVTRAIVRRDRMGHIELACPIAHIWMLRGIPSRMSLLLDVSVNKLEKVVYFAGYIITEVDETEKERLLHNLEQEYTTKMRSLNDEEEQEKLKEMYTETKNEIKSIKQFTVLNELEYHKFSMRYSTIFEANIGAEALYEIFGKLDLPAMARQIDEELETATKAKRAKMEKRLILVRSLINSNSNPQWMFLKAIPVIPPLLRPMIALEGGRHATSDVNDLYRRVINRNNRLKKLMKLDAPDVILRNEKRILQEAVDSLMDNSIRKSSGSAAMSQSQRRQLKSLSDNLKGKQGLFRSNLLGKRVDYSGRSVIVVGPRLKLNQCGLPKHMALELFRPFVIAKLIQKEVAFNIRGANRMVEEASPEVWEMLEEAIEGKYVMLNRAPTLHRLSIQAFQPVLVEGKAIQIHPLVCGAFNADFDGDQMAVHLPLSKEAQREARELVAANKNLLKPQTGKAITTPSQDIVLGCFWMTKEIPGSMGEGRIFPSVNEAISAYDYGAIDFRAKIMVRGSDTEKYAAYDSKPFETTVGRLRFNSIFPDDFAYENKVITKKDLSRLVQSVIDTYGIDAAPPMLDKMKEFGNYFVTTSGSTFSMEETKVPEEKKEVVKDAYAKVDEINEQFEDGLITDQERYRMTVGVWETATRKMSELLQEQLPNVESLHDMLVSGARGNPSQLNQSAGMKGVIVNAAGRELDFPIVSSYKEGFTPLEYFINTTTARKGLTDTALNTAKAGYLTRRLHDVAQDVVITEEDCGTKDFLIAKAEEFDGIKRSLFDNIHGRVAAKTVKDAEGKTLVKKNQEITGDIAVAIEEAGIEEVEIRSPLTCGTLHGLCRKCYGLDLGRTGLIKKGEAIGTVSAQAIGEPGTQLTLRTFHSGGVAGRDITQGLPRVEEIFENRTPKVPAVVAPADGMVSAIEKDEETGQEIITFIEDATDRTNKGSKTHTLAVDIRRIVTVNKGDMVAAGDLLTDGSADPQEIFDVANADKAKQYIINEITKVYELHGTAVDKKHLEVITRQMFSRIKVSNPGDTLLATGQVVERITFLQENQKMEAEGKMKASGKAVLMGISNVALSTQSWLSSASFQHTNRVLIKAAIEGRIDPLRGLKENIIAGNLIPAGTGFDEKFVDLSDIKQENEDAAKAAENAFINEALR